MIKHDTPQTKRINPIVTGIVLSFGKIGMSVPGIAVNATRTKPIRAVQKANIDNLIVYLLLLEIHECSLYVCIFWGIGND